ncbi:MAG: hypothetical protein NTZ65_03040 [Candidatus Berkelbacteria bacterium]|nr:hypothetical protein [Candidatus Berkelbacteria bacterium]
MQIINDPKIIRYRAALQNEREYLANDLQLHLQEMRDKAKNNIANKKPPFDEANTKILYNEIFSISRPHLELQTGDLWKKQTVEIQNETIQETTRQIIDKLRNNDEEFIQFSRTLVPMLIESNFINVLKKHGQ